MKRIFNFNQISLTDSTVLKHCIKCLYIFPKYHVLHTQAPDWYNFAKICASGGDQTYYNFYEFFYYNRRTKAQLVPRHHS